MNNKVVNTLRTKIYRVLKSNPTRSVSTEDVICEIDPNFGEFGVYDFHVYNDSCKVETLKEPVSIYFRKFSCIFFKYKGSLFIIIHRHALL